MSRHEDDNYKKNIILFAYCYNTPCQVTVTEQRQLPKSCHHPKIKLEIRSSALLPFRAPSTIDAADIRRHPSSSPFQPHGSRQSRRRQKSAMASTPFDIPIPVISALKFNFVFQFGFVIVQLPQAPCFQVDSFFLFISGY